MLWCGEMMCSAIGGGEVCCSVVWYSVALCGMVCCGAVCSSSALRCGALVRSCGADSVVWNGVQQCVVDWRAAVLCGVVRCGMLCFVVVWCGVMISDAVCCKALQYGVVWFRFLTGIQIFQVCITAHNIVALHELATSGSTSFVLALPCLVNNSNVHYFYNRKSTKSKCHYVLMFPRLREFLLWLWLRLFTRQSSELLQLQEHRFNY